MRKSTSLLTAAAITVALGSAGAGAQAALEPQQPSPAEAGQSGTTAVPVVQEEIEKNFAIFRTQEPATMPADVQLQVGSADRYGRNAALARSFATPYGAGWVIPGDGTVCIAVPTTTKGYASSCIPTSLAVERGLWIRVGSADGKVLDTMVVPDGTTAASGSKELATTPSGVASELSSGEDAPVPAVTRAG